MSTELWFRNPKNYIRELVETAQMNLAWDRGVLAKFNIDPHKFAELHYPGMEWRSLAIGGQGTLELGPNNDADNPVAVYPTWVYGDPNVMLEQLITENVGNDEHACFDLRTPKDERPVWGQKHMVVIAEGPPGGAGNSLGRKFYRYLMELQEDNPDCTIYLHNSYSYRVMFGLGFGAVDCDPRMAASKGKVTLSSGETMEIEKAMKNPKWLLASGMTVEDIKVPRNRCIFNINSAVWASKNYGELYNFRIKRDSTFSTDVVTPDVAYRGDSAGSHLVTKSRTATAGAGDYIVCDTCSLRDTCKYEREGAVCSVPDKDGVSLARFFKTRDSQMIVDGLQEIMKINVERMEEARAEEMVMGLNPEVTKLLNQIFGHGVQLAKLIDPNLRGAKVNVNVGVAGNGAQVAISQGNEKTLVASVIREIEATGVPRDKITPEMVQGVLEGMVRPDSRGAAIEGTVIGGPS